MRGEGDGMAGMGVLLRSTTMWLLKYPPPPPRSGCLKIVLGAWRVLSADIGRKGNDWIIIYPSENIIIDKRSLIQKFCLQMESERGLCCRYGLMPNYLFHDIDDYGRCGRLTLVLYRD